MAAADETLRLWGDNIKAVREQLTSEGQLRAHGADSCMTQAELGARLDPPVGQSVISRWERGLMEPRRNYKRQLADALHTDVKLLFPLTRSAA